MKSTKSFPGLWPALLAVLLLGGCARSMMASDPACQGEHWIESRLFFGRDISSGGQVTEEMWRDFVYRVVAPRFADGFTVIDGAGFWYDGARGKSENERSKILIILHPQEPALRQRLEEIAGLYIKRFRQQAVLADSRPTCVTFYEGSS